MEANAGTNGMGRTAPQTRSISRDGAGGWPVRSAFQWTLGFWSWRLPVGRAVAAVGTVGGQKVAIRSPWRTGELTKQR